MKSKSLIFALALLATLASCGNSAPVSTPEISFPASSSPVEEDPLPSWEDRAVTRSLKNFVVSATSPNSTSYIPVSNRVAVFDMDGTLYGELFPTYLEYLMFIHRAKYDETYHADGETLALADELESLADSHSYPSGTDMRHALAAAKAYAGMTLKEFNDYCVSFFKNTPDGFENMTYGTAFYQPMAEVVDYLHANDFQVYVVSGSDRFICRALCCDYLHIPENHIIGMDVRLAATDQGDTEGVNYTLKDTDKIVRTEDLLIKNLKFNKVAQIIKEIGIQPVLSFGNSGGDTAMHVYTKTNNPYPAEAFMLVADDDVRDYGVPEKAAKLAADWQEKGFQVVSMKNEFKTIYSPEVRRTSRTK